MCQAADPSASSYERSVNDWRAEHEAQLKADDGWLTVVGLNWLKEGENRVGSNPGLEVSLPKSTPPCVGTIIVKRGKAHFKPASGVAISLNGKPAPETDLTPDTVLALGRVKFFVIKREDKLAIRVKDNDSPARQKFTGMRWYPIDPSWRIQGTFVPWDQPRTLIFDTLVGVKERHDSPGYVSFVRNGMEYRLEPVIDDNELRFVLRDETSGKTTYFASRFLYAALPKTGLRHAAPVELDFNRAENPPVRLH